MRSFSLIMLGVVAIVAILGLLLLFKMGSTGSIMLNTYGGHEKVYMNAEKAQNLPEERFYGGGITPEGVISEDFSRKGRVPEYYGDMMGREPCNKGYALERIDAYKQGCIPTKYPRYYIGRQCCPESTY